MDCTPVPTACMVRRARSMPGAYGTFACQVVTVLLRRALVQVPDNIPKPDWYATGEPTAEIETRQQQSGKALHGAAQAGAHSCACLA